MGLRIFIDTGVTGVGGQAGTGFISANSQRLTNVLANVLPGNIVSVANTKIVAGVIAGGVPGSFTTSRTKSITGTSTTGSSGSLSTGSNTTSWGFNISGLEWVNYSFTRGTVSSAPNRDFAVPRDELIQYIANRGFKLTRLPFLWEMIQPVLSRQGALSTVLSAFGINQSGQLRPATVRMITQVLDAHTAAGIKCMLDMHNFCRYIDFLWNADGSVPGFTSPNTILMPFSSTGSVQTRIFSGGPAPSLTQADFNDVWVKIATQFKSHPALGGYMIMNEPHDLDALTTWPAYAQSCINAIRAVDPTTPIYVGSNNFTNSTTLATQNPGFPLTGANLVYEAHLYMDATDSGKFFDYDLEVAKGTSVGEVGPISANTGFNRLKLTTDWLDANVKRGAVTESGMPLDDIRWVTEFKGALDLAWQKGLEWYTWMSGDHWPIHSYPVNYVPGYYQGRSFEPKVGGVMKQTMGLQNFSLFDSSQSYANGGGVVVSVTLFCRGNVTAPFTINLTRTAGTGSLSGASVVMPAGANPSVSYTYTTVANEKAVITYSGPAQIPPARSIYSYTDPVTLAATNLPDAGRTLLAKYNCCEWLSSNSAKDYLGANSGVAAITGDLVRAIPDTGFASRPENTFEMTNWVRQGADYGTITPPSLVVSAGLSKLDTVGATSNNFGTVMAQHVNPVLGSINKVLACYYTAWDQNAIPLVTVPLYFNLVYLFHLKFAGPLRDVNNNGDGTVAFLDQGNITAAQVQTLRNRGQKVIMTIGGAQNGYNITTRAQSTNLVNSFISVVTGLGGVDGIDFNNYEQQVRSSANELIFIVQSLRAHFGQGFLACSPPGGGRPSPDPVDLAMLQAMNNAGCLSWIQPQFYDDLYDPTLIAHDLDVYKTAFNGDASKIMLGFPANHNVDFGTDVPTSAAVYDTFAAANPSVRGSMCWDALINQQSTTISGSGNVWGLWSKKFDPKTLSGGLPVQPNGKETVLFDIHDPHFVVAAVELQNSSTDGAIFATSSSMANGHSELGIGTGGMPTANFLDFNGNTLALRGLSGLTAGAHVLSVQSTGTAQTLRSDTVSVATGIRTLTSNAAIGSDSHTMGWGFYNFFERNAPGAFVYSVVAGKGNPTTAELTVIERYLGNTTAGLSL